MKIAGVVAEYNPFHTGHAYHLHELRKKTGARYVLCVMSGSFVQRGEPAVYDKFTRARAALLCGADMVVELPVQNSLQSAQGFATGAVYMLDALRSVDYLGFSTEDGEQNTPCGEQNVLRGESEAMRERVKAELNAGKSYPRAYFEAAKAVLGDDADVLRKPNALLGVEYVNVLNRLGSAIAPVVTKRVCVSHDAENVCEGFASASYLRGKIAEGYAQDCAKLAAGDEFYADVAQYLPNAELYAGKSPVFSDMLSAPMLYSLRERTESELMQIAGVGEGLERLLYACSRSAKNAEDLFLLMKSKRYTMARIKRICMCAMLGITKDIASRPPEYIRVLGMRKDAAPLLSALAKSSRLPLIVRNSDINALSPAATAQFMLNARATDVYFLATPDMRARRDFTRGLIVV